MSGRRAPNRTDQKGSRPGGTPPSSLASRPDLLGLSPEELESLVVGLGEPRYRARQLFLWLHRGAAFPEMTDLPAALRLRLAEQATAGSLTLTDQVAAPDGTAKFAFSTADQHLVETVLIPHANRTTVCVSSQIGCGFRCRFCATGRHGFTRDLTAAEIVEQVVKVQARCASRRVSNVVFMGMGEPLANYEAVIRAIRLLNHPWGLNLAARHMAVSTCGLPEGIRRLAGEGLQVALAVSLHAATDELRDRLVPINRRHPLAQLMSAVREWLHRTGRKVTFEWVVVAGVNDTPEQAAALARLIRGMQAVVNLIPYHPPAGGDPDVAPAYAFAARLRRHGLEVAVRRSRGAEVLGACGQLTHRRDNAAPSRSAPARD